MILQYLTHIVAKRLIHFRGQTKQLSRLSHWLNQVVSRARVWQGTLLLKLLDLFDVGLSLIPQLLVALLLKVHLLKTSVVVGLLSFGSAQLSQSGETSTLLLSALDPNVVRGSRKSIHRAL